MSLKKTSTLQRFLIPVAIVVIIVAAIYAYTEASRQVGSIRESALSQAQVQMRLLTLTESLVSDKVNASMRLFRDEAQTLGQPEIEGMINFKGNTIPNIVFGRVPQANTYELVDRITKITGGTATIFAKTGENFVRISTNIKQSDGTRAVGTLLDPKGKAIQAIRKGQAFYGIVDILGNPYITGYEPMMNAGGEVIGIWYVGYEANIQALRDTVENTRFLSSGFSAMLDSHGEIRYVSKHILKATAQKIIDKQLASWVLISNDVPRWDFKIVFAYPKREARAAGYAKAFYIILTAIIITLTLFAVIGVRLKQLVIDPIGTDPATATTIVKRISRGDLHDDNLIAQPNTLMADILTMRDNLRAMVAALHVNSDRLALAASVFEHTHDGIFITDQNINIVQVNPAFERLTGFSKEEAIGKNPQALNFISFDKETAEKMEFTIKAQGEWHGEIENQRKNGDFYIAALAVSTVYDDQKNLSHYVGVFSDITILKNQQQTLEHMAYYDSLTQLPNRVLFLERLNQTLSISNRNNEQTAICFLDLDGFKPVNDNFGHEAGDQLLMELADRARACVRASDTIARMGGDEFALLLCGLKTEDEAHHAIERLLASIKAPYLIKEKIVRISASAGLVVNLDNKSDVEKILQIADKTMYQAKVLGKDKYEVFNWQSLSNT